MENLKIWVCGIIGSIGGAITSLLGGWSTDLHTLIIFMAIDFFMGLLLGLVFKKSSKTSTGALESNACFKGLCKKGVGLLIVLIGHRLDLTLKTDYIRTTVIIALIVNELISMVENAGLMGFPMPKIIINSIDMLKKKSDIE